MASVEAAPSSGRRDAIIVWLSLCALVAWTALWLSGGRIHGSHAGSAGAFQSWLNTALLFVGSWTVMTIAMMLPTSLPLVSLFQRMVAGRDERRLLTVLLVLGYLLVWAATGLVSWGGVLAVRAAAGEWGVLGSRAVLGDAVVLLVAGAFQFSALKYRCLDQCRSPRSFLMSHWRGGRSRLNALELGFHHGLFCVGCCWALMLLMFAAGANGLAWMLGLAALMAVEKNTSWGRRLVAPSGAVLLVWGSVNLGLTVLAG